MEFTFTEGHANPDFSGGAVISFKVDKTQRAAAEEFYSCMKENDKPYTAKITRKRNKRSLDANAYFWLLCGKIAEKAQQVREDVYGEMIRRNGEYVDVLVDDEKARGVIRAWQGNGIGWFTEFVRDSKEHDGYSWHRLYSGSSTYDTKQMSKLIDAVIAECKDLDIETMTPDEIERLKNSWR